MKLHLANPNLAKRTAALIASIFVAVLSGHSAVVTNLMVGIDGVNVGTRTVNFYPKSTPQTFSWNGTNATVMDLAKNVTSTNGAWAKTFVGGLYYADFGTVNNGIKTPQVLFLVPPNDTNTYDFNYCANLATNLGTFTWTNPVSDLSAAARVEVTNIARSISPTLPNSATNAITNNQSGVTLAGTFTGNGLGLQLPNSATNALTNVTSLLSTFQSTNVLYWPQYIRITNSTLYPFLNSTNWQRTNNAYVLFPAKTNFLYYADSFNTWVISTNLTTADSFSDVIEYGSIGGNLPLPSYDNEWSEGNTGTPDTTQVFPIPAATLATYTNAQVSSNGVALRSRSVTGETVLSVKDGFGRTMIEVVPGSGPISSYPSIYYYTEPNYPVIATSPNSGLGGIYGYGYNNRCLTYWPDSESRFNFQVASIFGANGIYGSKSEFGNRADSTWNSAGNNGLQEPLIITAQGYVGIGAANSAEHTLDYRLPAELTLRSLTVSSNLQMLLEPCPTYTGIMTNGGMYSDGTRIHAIQSTKDFPIPQINTTNATLSAATTFTWKFSYPFSATNYSVTVTGGGVTLGTNVVIGAKTTTNVVITFPSFTGILNAIAARQ